MLVLDEGGEDETINVHKNMKDSEVIESLKNPGEISLQSPRA